MERASGREHRRIRARLRRLLRRGQETGGRRVGLRLAMEYADRLDSAVWNGWLQRATRLLADEPECIEQGMARALPRPFGVRAGRGRGGRAARARGRGDRCAVRGPGPRGVRAGAGGRDPRDAHTARAGTLARGRGDLAAVGGELTPYAAGNIYCITIGVCRSVADYRRAAEWTEAAARWCEREAITGFPGICRVQRAEIMRLRGSYAEAEDEASKAQTELEGFGRLLRGGGRIRSGRGADAPR